MKRWTVLFAAVALLGVAAFAQNRHEDEGNTRSVRGIVTDSASNPVAGAVVQLKNTKTLQVRSFLSLEDGSYRFHGLNTDVDYELRAEKENAASGSKTLSQYDSKKMAIINLKLDARR